MNNRPMRRNYFGQWEYDPGAVMPMYGVKRGGAGWYAVLTATGERLSPSGTLTDALQEARRLGKIAEGQANDNA